MIGHPYLDRGSPVHLLDPRTKIVCFLLLSIAPFLFNSPVYVAVTALVVVGLGALARSLKSYLRVRYLPMLFLVVTFAHQGRGTAARLTGLGIPYRLGVCDLDDRSAGSHPRRGGDYHRAGAGGPRARPGRPQSPAARSTACACGDPVSCVCHRVCRAAVHGVGGQRASAAYQAHLLHRAAVAARDYVALVGLVAAITICVVLRLKGYGAVLPRRL